ncbi:uncharacterized protein EV422DRAFT_521870 [Fimicolochytrium jonesii]|uniref:uncharacterized protein n=1 Tax=Fimicolochytrium jonesii TaxID=1396493 RepID=UPI0022FDD1BD|nr:uncharacterized protein EV422DRAFT_521870 [Fimicolochytrium jonesii]KAI8823654.1 hypothetical protein EV422DRAFT_521870 [Fimicolochytrium jonesii]
MRTAVLLSVLSYTLGVQALKWPTASYSCTTGQVYTCTDTSQVTLSSSVTYSNCNFKNCGPLRLKTSGTTLTLTDVTIDGTGIASTDADDEGLLRILSGSYLVATRTTFKNITGTPASLGGALYVKGSTFNGINVIFDSNTASSGGAAYLINGASFSCSGCTFKNNVVVPDSGSTTYGGALAVIKSSSLTLSTTTFTNNRATSGGGGAVYLGGSGVSTASATGTTFTSNVALDGGAVLLDSNSVFTATDCNFYGSGSSLATNGGALQIAAKSALTWTGGSCAGVDATHGACVYVTSENTAASTATIKNVVFRDSSISSSLLETSNAVSRISATNLTVRNINTLGTGAVLASGVSVFRAISEDVAHFAILSRQYGEGVHVLDGCTFSGLTAVSGGIASVQTGSTVISNSRITNVTGTAGAGAVTASLGAVVNITSSSINGASSAVAGGAVMATGATINLVDTTVTLASAPKGGVAYIAEKSTLGCYGSSTLSGTATANGGCIVNSGSSVLLSDSCTLTNCVAGQGGGGVYNFESGNTTLRNQAVIHLSSAATFGGAITTDGAWSHVYLHDQSVLRNNSAGICGGGLATATDSFALDQSILELNRAPCGPIACLRNTTEVGSLYVLDGVTIGGVVDWLIGDLCNGQTAIVPDPGTSGGTATTDNTGGGGGVPTSAVIGGTVGAFTTVVVSAGIFAVARYGKGKKDVQNLQASATELRMAQENPLYISPAPMTENPIYEVDFTDTAQS